MLAHLPFIQARWYRTPRRALIRLIVVHDMEVRQSATTAENVARMFATTNRAASAHVSVDQDSAVRSVREGDVAFAAPGANDDGYHIEHAGYARYTRRDWLHQVGMLRRSAAIAADVAHRHKIPVRHLTVDEVRGGKVRGFCGHVDVTNAFHESTHTDPGTAFPWDLYLGFVNEALLAYRRYVRARPGDSLASIAARKGLTVHAIQALNPRITRDPDKRLIHVGRKVRTA